MPYRLFSSDTRSLAQRIGVNYDHLVFNRSFLLWLHVGLAFAAAFMYLTTLDTTHLRWWRRGAGDIALMRSSISMVPYVISAIVSRRRVTARRFGVWVLALILVAGTACVGYFYVTRIVDQVPVFGTLSAIGVQTAVYVLAAVICLPRGVGE